MQATELYFTLLLLSFVVYISHFILTNHYSNNFSIVFIVLESTYRIIAYNRYKK